MQALLPDFNLDLCLERLITQQHHVFPAIQGTRGSSTPVPSSNYENSLALQINMQL